MVESKTNEIERQAENIVVTISLWMDYVHLPPLKKIKKIKIK